MALRGRRSARPWNDRIHAEVGAEKDGPLHPAALKGPPQRPEEPVRGMALCDRKTNEFSSPSVDDLPQAVAQRGQRPMIARGAPGSKCDRDWSPDSGPVRNRQGTGLEHVPHAWRTARDILFHVRTLAAVRN